MATLANSGLSATSLDRGSFSVFVGLKLNPVMGTNNKPLCFGWVGANRTLAYNKATKAMNKEFNSGNEIVYVLDQEVVVVAQIYKRYIVEQKIGAAIKKRAAQKLTKSVLLECFAGLDLGL